MDKIKVGYQENEWTVLYNDADGNAQVEYFNLYNDAVGFLNGCYFKIGIVTTSYYQNVICK